MTLLYLGVISYSALQLLKNEAISLCLVGLPKKGDDPCYPTNHHFMSAQKNPKSWDTEETDSYIDNFGANLMGYIYSRYSRTALKPPAPEVILHRRQ